MLYLVTTDHFSRSSPRTPEETELLHEQVTTSIEILSKLESQGKILAGGVISGQRRHIFIIDAESNEEVTELVQRLPFWIEHEWEILPLETWNHYLDFLTQYREEMGLKYLI
ncbi:hypothetical protein CMK22_10290 [Candidatus Poribacteria bacterium]|nr:hypothetical protein [Candidatus Poribacteria bacterium]